MGGLAKAILILHAQEFKLKICLTQLWVNIHHHSLEELLLGGDHLVLRVRFLTPGLLGSLLLLQLLVPRVGLLPFYSAHWEIKFTLSEEKLRLT